MLIRLAYIIYLSWIFPSLLQLSIALFPNVNIWTSSANLIKVVIFVKKSYISSRSAI